jgi:hypothetical protein
VTDTTYIVSRYNSRAAPRAARRPQDAQQRRELRAELAQLGPVHGGQLLQPLAAAAGQPQVHAPAVVPVRLAVEQAQRHQAVDQPHRAVMPDGELRGQFADRRPPAGRPGADGQQRLVLLRAQAERPRGRLAEGQELPQRGAEAGQGRVLVIPDWT